MTRMFWPRLPVAAVVILPLVLYLAFLGTYPRVQADEVVFGDPALTVATSGFIGTGLFRGVFPGFEQHVYWMPPLFSLVLGGWFKVVGFGLTQGRLFSALCGVAVAMAVYRLARYWAAPGYALVGSLVSAASSWLIFASRIIRMDILAVGLILASAILLVEARKRAGVRWFCLCGLFAGLAPLAHPLAVVAIVAAGLELSIAAMSARGRNWAQVGGFLVGAGVPLAGWAMYALQDYSAFWTQMGAQLDRKANVPGYLYQFQLVRLEWPALAVLLAGGVWLVLGARARSELRYPAMLTVVAFLAATVSRADYFVYYVPLLAVGTALLLQRLGPKVTVAIAIVALGNELALFGYHALHDRGRDPNVVYAQVREAIPAGASTFIAPGGEVAYFALQGRNPVRIWIPVKPPPGYAISDAVTQADYTVASVPVLYYPVLDPLLASERQVARIRDGVSHTFVVYAVR